MRLLLDTHAAIWWLDDSSRLGEAARAALAAPSNERLLSACVVWEIAIKRALKKLSVSDAYVARLLEYEIAPLPITLKHAEAVEQLPCHHDDPFDRLLVAQAQIEGATIVSRDPRFKPYDVPVLW